MEFLDLRKKTRSAAFLAALLWAGAVAADYPLYVPPSLTPVVDHTGLWSEATPPSQLYLATDLADLEDHAADIAAEGLRLEAFESWLEGGERRYAGVFRPGTGGRHLVTGMGATDFENARLAHNAASRYLIDVEVELVDDVRVYSGLFRTAFSTVEVVHQNSDAAAFAAEVAALPAHRLLSFDTWWEDGELHSYAVFRAGSALQETVVGLAWEDFWDEAVDLGALGYRLVDIEITEVPQAVDLVSGRFVVMAPERDWLAVCLPLAAYLEAHHSLFDHGYYASSINFDPDEGLSALPGAPLGLLDLEIGRDWVVAGPGPNQLKPLHDSGTPGPPRWP